jgi:hypothetical protein
MPAVADIISRPQFQRYLKNIVTTLIGSEPFRWTKCTPPWRLPTLIRWSFVEESWGRPESKGIFILPHEALEETWNFYINMPKFSRSFGNNNVDHESIHRYKPNGWLNDELVNSYVALLPDSDDGPSIKVTGSYAFQKLHNPLTYQKDFFKRLVRLVFSMPPSSLISLQLGGKNQNRGLTVEKLLAQFSKILIPLNWKENHWILAILSIEKKEVLILDSLESYTGSMGRQNIFNVSSALIVQILASSHRVQILKEKIPLPDEWRFQEIEGIPQQRNSFDCGVYCCQFIKYTYFGRSIPKWETKDAGQLRRMMAMEMYEGSLRWFEE